MIQAEKREKRPSSDLFERQSNITPVMRETMVDWMIDIHRKYGMHPETLFVAVHILDLYLCRLDLDKSSYQRLACAALVLAAKSDERTCPPLDEFVHLADNSFAVESLRQMEASAFDIVGSHVHPILPIQFLNRYLNLLNADDDVSTVAFITCDVLLLDPVFIGVKPSYLAACILAFALGMVQGAPRWKSLLESNTGYTLKDLNPTMNLITDSVQHFAASSPTAIRKKYGSRFPPSFGIAI
jgi:hypothetical protein